MLIRLLILPPCSFVRTEENDNLGIAAAFRESLSGVLILGIRGVCAGTQEKDILGAAREALSATMLIRWGLLPYSIG